MSFMKPFSTELPDCFVQITDDTQAKAFLVALGIFDRLSKDITLSQADARTNDDTIIEAFYDHPTHWICAGRFYGLHDEKENGFVVIGWPRNKFQKDVVVDFISTIPLGDKVTVDTEDFGDVKPPLS